MDGTPLTRERAIAISIVIWKKVVSTPGCEKPESVWYGKRYYLKEFAAKCPLCELREQTGDEGCQHCPIYDENNRGFCNCVNLYDIWVCRANLELDRHNAALQILNLLEKAASNAT
jgi:hypothetical protein